MNALVRDLAAMLAFMVIALGVYIVVNACFRGIVAYHSGEVVLR